MQTREAVIAFCKTFSNVVEDYPFDDETVAMRHKGRQRRIFALIMHHQGGIWVNVKNQPGWCEFWRQQYPDGVVPGYHMNKQHWNSIVLGAGVPREQIEQMITESYLLTRSPGGKEESGI